MSTDDTPKTDGGEHANSPDERRADSEGETGELVGSDVRDRLGEEAERAIDQFDEGLIDLLAWILETETRARIYISLRKEPEQTSDEIAERSGLYPSTVREALAELHEDSIVTRDKRQNNGAGNNPYEYSAIPPSELVGDVVEDIQEHLNAVFNLDGYLHRPDESEDASEPVTITVTDQSSDDEPTDISIEEESEDTDPTEKQPDDSEGSDGQ